jgi:hypothetical protein
VANIRRERGANTRNDIDNKAAQETAGGRHAKAFCGTNPYTRSALDLVFVIVKEIVKEGGREIETGRNRLFILPTGNRDNWDIPTLVKWFTKTVLAFGYVKGVSEAEKMAAQGAGVDDGMTSWHPTAEDSEKVKKEITTLEPVDFDVKLSVQIDKAIGRPIYYIIMNKKFEYNIYKSPTESLYGLMKPAEE